MMKVGNLLSVRCQTCRSTRPSRSYSRQERVLPRGTPTNPHDGLNVPYSSRLWSSRRATMSPNAIQTIHRISLALVRPCSNVSRSRIWLLELVLTRAVSSLSNSSRRNRPSRGLNECGNLLSARPITFILAAHHARPPPAQLGGVVLFRTRIT